MNRKTHAFRDMEPEKLDSILSNYLIDSWSYSGVSTFARNEKAFEMEYIYRIRGKRSASSIAGNAYHSALEAYFTAKSEGTEVDLVDCESIGFAYIDTIPAHDWKLQKTTPSVEDCITQAQKIFTACIKNFFAEKSIFSEVKTILGVELRLNEFLNINGVDIPLPCHLVVDLVAETVEGKTVLIDHKTKSYFTPEDEAEFSNDKQAIIYALGYEAATARMVDEVWICENKYSQNRDNSPQLKINKTVLDYDTRRLYEAKLYEPLKAMIEAVSNPDHVYLINDADNFVDKADINQFWARTMIAEVSDFVEVPENKKDLIEKRLRKIRDASLASISPQVIKNFQSQASSFITYDLSKKNMSNEEKIQHRLRSFGLPAQISHKFDGYSSDTYLLELQAGTKFSSLYKHRLDIANALGVESVRMDENLLVHEGKSYFVVESAKKRDRDLAFSSSAQTDQKIPVGVNNFGKTVYWDLGNPSTSHALVCGATGSGKSVFLFAAIEYAKLCGVEEFIIFDPKFEFTKYQGQAGFEVYNDIDECEIRLEDLVLDMNHRVRNRQSRLTMVIFDEFADAVQSARTSRQLDDGEKTLEQNLKLLLQKGRSSGFRIVAATQRASTKVITGDAKVNFPVQICFRVPKAIDSKVVIDSEGAESLAGQGDGLMRSPDYPNLVRFQGYYV